MNVPLPPDLLEAIDRVTNNRSRFLADAAREKLQHARYGRYSFATFHITGSGASSIPDTPARQADFRT